MQRVIAVFVCLQNSSPEPSHTSHSIAPESEEIYQALLHSQSEVRQLIQANKNLQNEVERLNNLVCVSYSFTHS